MSEFEFDKLEWTMFVLTAASIVFTALFGVVAKQLMGIEWAKKSWAKPVGSVFAVLAVLGVPFTLGYATFVGWAGYLLVSAVVTIASGVFTVKLIKKNKTLSAVLWGI